MADLVENVLREAAEKESKYKTTEVHKDIDLEIDEGNLMTTDTNPFNVKLLRYVAEKINSEGTQDRKIKTWPIKKFHL